MRGLFVVAATLALAAARPEVYKEKEDFQYARSSSDEGTKSGYYGAQRGNTGGNYERAHNMDKLAQSQMSGLVRQVDGELGDGIQTKAGSVYSAANSRGIYGSGHYDTSNLQGRNFQEGLSYGDGNSAHSSLNSQQSAFNQQAAYNAAHRHNSGYSTNQNSRYTGYQSLGHQALQSENLQAAQVVDNVNAANQYYGTKASQSGYHSQSGYQGFSGYDQSGADSYRTRGYDSNVRLVGAAPARVVIRPGTFVTIPVAAQTYDATHQQTSSAYDQAAHNYNALSQITAQSAQKFDAAHQQSTSSFDHNSLVKNDAQVSTDLSNSDVNYRPLNNNKHYDSSYSYQKQWEKHDTKPSVIPLAIPTVYPIPKNSELYEDNIEQQNAGNIYSGKSAYNSAIKSSSSSQLQHQSDYSALNHGSSNLNSNAYSDALSNSASANLVQGVNSKPKSYQSSYSYHKSWERQGDPYVIKPVSEGLYNGQISQKLTAADNQYSSQQYDALYKQTHRRVTNAGLVDCDCDEEGHPRLRRSYSPSEYIQRLGNPQLRQQTQDAWKDEEILRQPTQNRLSNLDNLGQQRPKFSNWNDLEIFEQEPQNVKQRTWNRSQHYKHEDQNWDQQEQNQWKIVDQENEENFGQQTQTQWMIPEMVVHHKPKQHRSYAEIYATPDIPPVATNFLRRTPEKPSSFQGTWNTISNIESYQVPTNYYPGLVNTELDRGLDDVQEKKDKNSEQHSQVTWYAYDGEENAQEIGENFSKDKNINNKYNSEHQRSSNEEDMSMHSYSNTNKDFLNRGNAYSEYHSHHKFNSKPELHHNIWDKIHSLDREAKLPHINGINEDYLPVSTTSASKHNEETTTARIEINKIESTTPINYSSPKAQRGDIEDEDFNTDSKHLSSIRVLGLQARKYPAAQILEVNDYRPSQLNDFNQQNNKKKDFNKKSTQPLEDSNQHINTNLTDLSQQSNQKMEIFNEQSNYQLQNSSQKTDLQLAVYNQHPFKPLEGFNEEKDFNTENRQHLVDFYEQSNQQLEYDNIQNTQLLEDFDKKVYQQLEDINQLSSQQLKDFNQETNQQLDDFNQKTSRQLEDFSQKTNQQLEDFNQESNQDLPVEVFNYQSDQQVHDINIEDNQELEKMSERGDQRLVDFHQKIKQQLEKISERGDQQLVDFHQKIKQQLEDYNQNYNELLENQQKQELGYISVKNNQQLQKFNQRSTQPLEDFNQQSSQQLEDFNKKKQQKFDDFNQQLEKFNQQSTQPLEDIYQTNNQQLEDFNQENNQQLEDFNQENNQQLKTFNQQSTQPLEDFNHQSTRQLEDLNKKNNQQLEDFNQKNNQQLETFNQQSTRPLEDFNQQSTQQLEDLSQKNNQQLEDFNQENNQQLETFNQQSTQPLEDFNQQSTRQLEDLNQKNNQQLEYFNQKNNQQLETFNQQSTQPLEDFNQQSTQQLEDLSQKNNQQLEDFNQENNQQLEDIKEQSNQQFEDIREQNNQQLEDLSVKNIEKISQESNQQFKNVSQKSDQQLEDFKPKSDQQLEEFNQQRNQQLEDFNQQRNQQLEDFNEQSNQIKYLSQDKVFLGQQTYQHLEDFSQQSNQQLEVISQQSLSNVEKEPSTEKPGFWKSIGNKLSDAKGKVVTWFSKN